jgi:phosphatidylserine/phosphatidylglycerophosphate/cardiolipin synthase-like enzyme
VETGISTFWRPSPVGTSRGRGLDEIALDDHPNIKILMFIPSRASAGALRRGMAMAGRPFSVRRMHNKACIADGTLAIVGGRIYLVLQKVDMHVPSPARSDNARQWI